MRVGMMKNTLKNIGKQVFTLSKIWVEITKIQKLIIGLNLDIITSNIADFSTYYSAKQS